MQPQATGRPSDGELLACFARNGEEASFAELVRRHQTLVYNACLRVLRRASDAEDAAQAVFLALSHRAKDAALQRRVSLASWLYTAAWHVSTRAREAARRRKQREREAGTMQEQTADAAAQWSQLAPVLDGELNKLPEKYRLAIVLHHLEQRTVEETAMLIQCSADAVKQRLTRGREMLKGRLMHRGVLLSAAALASLLTSQASGAAAPASLSGATVQAAVLLFSGQGAASGEIAALAKAAADAMTPKGGGVRAADLASTVLLLAAMAAGALWWLHSAPVAATAPQKPVAPPAVVTKQSPEGSIPKPDKPTDDRTPAAWHREKVKEALASKEDESLEKPTKEELMRKFGKDF